MGELRPVRRHRVFARDRPDDDHIFVGPLVPHDADTLDRQQDGERLPEFPVVIPRPDLFHQHRVGVPEDDEPFFGHLADDPHRKPRSRKGLSPDDIVGHPELFSEEPDLVLEEVLQRLDELQLHFFRESPHVVVGFDDGAGSAKGRLGFDQIRIERPLGEKLRTFDLLGLPVEDLDEDPADDLPLPFRIRHPLQAVDKRLPRPREPNVHSEIFPEEGPDLLRLAQPQESVVHKDAGKPTADRLVEQNGRNGGIDPPGKTENHPLVADRLPDLFNSALNEGFHRPALCASTDAKEKIFQHLFPLGCVDHLRVELEAVEPSLRILGGGHLGVLCRGGDPEAFRQTADPVAVAHPAARLLLNAGEDATPLFPDVQFGETVLTLVRTDHLSSQRIDHELEAVTDPQDRNAKIENPLCHPW